MKPGEIRALLFRGISLFVFEIPDKGIKRNINMFLVFIRKHVNPPQLGV
jgi:hypothetical protein